MQARALKEEFVDPVCGMTVDPARAAGTSERDGVRYYFCSPGCKEKFDSAGGGGASLPAASCCAPAQIGAPPADAGQSQESCCGGDAAAAPVQLSAVRPPAAGQGGFADAALGTRPAHEGHAHHGHVGSAPQHKQ